MARAQWADEDRGVHSQRLARHTMQATLIRHDTKAWKAQVWISFFTAALLCATGLAFYLAAISIFPS
jgi:hypothetical protein